MVARVKKNDTVQVLHGKDKGKRGTIIEILPKTGKIIVKGCGIVTRHVKARKQGEIAGIKKQEAYLKLCQVMPVCSSCNKPCRVNARVSESGITVRICNQCEKVF